MCAEHPRTLYSLDEEFSNLSMLLAAWDPGAVVAIKAMVQLAPFGAAGDVSRCLFVVFTRPVPFPGLGEPKPGTVFRHRMPLYLPLSATDVSRVEDAVADFDRRCPGAQSRGNWGVALAALRRHVSEPGLGGRAVVVG